MKNKADILTKIPHNELLEKLNYNPLTGIFTWRDPGKKLCYLIGKVAGSIDRDGYRIIDVNKVKVRASRLAYYYFYEKTPEKTIDHINRKRDDNRISNLRDVDMSIQNKNRSKK